MVPDHHCRTRIKASLREAGTYPNEVVTLKRWHRRARVEGGRPSETPALLGLQSSWEHRAHPPTGTDTSPDFVPTARLQGQQPTHCSMGSTGDTCPAG